MPNAASGVVIVGAGPTGLLLSAELALAGVRCVVLERRPGPRDDSRAICVHARSMEVLDLRGQAGVFADAGLAVPSFPLGLRGTKIDFGVLDSDFAYLLDMPQSQIERLLLARALELSAEVRWSATVTSVSQDDSGVTVALADGSTERAAFVVGCDGVHSFVRNAAAIPFPGIHNPGSVILADLHLDDLPMDAAYGDLSRDGMLLVFPFRDGSCRVVLYDYSRAEVPVTEPVDLAEVRTSLRRVTGQDFGPRDLDWSGRYRSESRQVPRYREGRILLAGDAAHAHSPAGAQGMNTGLQDAVNLGWKLGAELAGWGPDWLLDSYHDERHPVGAEVLALTGRQFALNTAKTSSRRALRWAVHRLVVPLPPVQARLARDYSGLSIAYPPPPDPVSAPTPAAAAPGTSAALVTPPQSAGTARPAVRAEAAVHPLTGARLPRGSVRLANPADLPSGDSTASPPGPDNSAGPPGADTAVGVAGADDASGLPGSDDASGLPGADSVAGPPSAGSSAGPPGADGAAGVAANAAGLRGADRAARSGEPAGSGSLAGRPWVRLAELFHDGRFVLLDGSGGEGPAFLPDRVRTVRFSQIDTEGFPAVALVRPDGYVAWASDDPDPAARAAAAERAVRLWCGPR